MRTIVRNSYTPKTGDYCSMIVVDNDKQVQYIFDCDGVWTAYTSKNQEGAPKSYVDARDAEILAAAKAYADEGDDSTLGAAKAYTDTVASTNTYVDQQDAATLADAKAYADQQDAAVLQSAKDYADSMDVITLGEAQTLVTNASTSVSDTLGGRITNLESSLATVATTGAYSDLIGAPDVPVITMTTVDPGEGSPLAENHFVAVYVGA